MLFVGFLNPQNVVKCVRLLCDRIPGFLVNERDVSGFASMLGGIITFNPYGVAFFDCVYWIMAAGSGSFEFAQYFFSLIQEIAPLFLFKDGEIDQAATECYVNYPANHNDAGHFPTSACFIDSVCQVNQAAAYEVGD